MFLISRSARQAEGDAIHAVAKARARQSLHDGGDGALWANAFQLATFHARSHLHVVFAIAIVLICANNVGQPQIADEPGWIGNAAQWFAWLLAALAGVVPIGLGLLDAIEIRSAVRDESS